MRRRQCRLCDKSNRRSNEDHGKVIHKENAVDRLPGLGKEKFDIRVYTVKCKKCGRKWKYRKKKG